MSKFQFYSYRLDVHSLANLAPSTALNDIKISPTLRSVTNIWPSIILPSSIKRRRAIPGRHPAWRGGVTHRPPRRKATLRMEVSITCPSGQCNITSFGVPGSTPTAGIPTLARARLNASRWVVLVVVNTEGEVGSVSRCTEIEGSDGRWEEIGFDIAA